MIGVVVIGLLLAPIALLGVIAWDSRNSALAAKKREQDDWTFAEMTRHW